MGVNWMDVSAVSFNAILLLERVQLRGFPGWVPEAALGVALAANPAVAWFMRHKCPELGGWLDGVEAGAAGRPPATAADVRQAETAVLQAINDLVVYALDPARYDSQPFLGWDSRELTAVADFQGKTVVDIGAGTGRLALVAAAAAAAVFAIEPVANLRHYLANKARAQGRPNVFAIDGVITDVPLPDGVADVTMAGYVFGDAPAAELREMGRLTRPGGLMVLCPGNVDRDNDIHRHLVQNGFAWSRFETPGDGTRRKYWRRQPGLAAKYGAEVAGELLE